MRINIFQLSSALLSVILIINAIIIWVINVSTFSFILYVFSVYFIGCLGENTFKNKHYAQDMEDAE